jgi:hypothetical protein
MLSLCDKGGRTEPELTAVLVNSFLYTEEFVDAAGSDALTVTDVERSATTSAAATPGGGTPVDSEESHQATARRREKTTAPGINHRL